MKPSVLCAITALCCLLASGAVADAQTSVAPKAAPPATDAIDGTGFFHLGEMYEAFNWATFYPATGDRLAERFDQFAAECRRLGAPKEVLDDIDAVRKAKLSQAFLIKPYDKWTDVEKKQFAEARGLNFTLCIKWLNELGFEPRFFWHLGRDTLRGWFVAGREVAAGNATIRAYEDEIRLIVKNAARPITDAGFAKARSKLTPEALAAIKAIADQSQLIEDPFGEGVTKTIFDVIVANCRVLRDLARDKKLTLPPSSGAEKK